jgi:hypothetical protein
VTHGRLLQVNAEWRLYGQGMNRIRHYFLELAPEMERYFHRVRRPRTMSR